MKSLLISLLLDSIAARGGGVSRQSAASSPADDQDLTTARISNYYQSNPAYASYGLSRWYNKEKVTEATSNVSPYVTIFGGEVTYKNTITLEESTVNEDVNIWIGIILIVVFIIAVFIMMCFINQFQWLMGCCYSK